MVGIEHGAKGVQTSEMQDHNIVPHVRDKKIQVKTERKPCLVFSFGSLFRECLWFYPPDGSDSVSYAVTVVSVFPRSPVTAPSANQTERMEIGPVKPIPSEITPNCINSLICSKITAALQEAHQGHSAT